MEKIKSLIEEFASSKGKYGMDLTTILYEPTIEYEENEVLKSLIKEKPEINIFTEWNEAFNFVKDSEFCLVTLIVSEFYDAEHIIHDFEASESTLDLKRLGSRFDIGEDSFLKLAFYDIPEEIRESLSLKAYVFMKEFEALTEVEIPEDEEEVMLMCDIKDIVKEFRQDLIILWYDSSINPERKRKLEEGIEWEIQEKNVYKDFQELLARIKEDSQTSYHLILSEETKAAEVQELAKEVENLKDLLGLYIVCNDDNISIENNDKIVVHQTLEELIPQIKEEIRTRSKLKNSFPAFATNFDSLDRSGIYKLHYYLQGLINFHNRRQAKEDFIKLARKVYQDEEKELARFEAKYHEYNKADILWWYTKDSPIYKLINNCLRIATSDSILSCRLILRDLETAIREQCQEKSKDFSGVVYRGAFISKDEWEKLEKNIGQEVEMYGFLSTSKKKGAALRFFEADLENKIFIKIIIPSLPEPDEQGFADISEFSHIKREEEILFNVRSRFRILEAVKKIDDQGNQRRYLVLLYGAQSLRKYMTKSNPTIEINLELPPEIKCNLCGSKDSLFGFKQHEETAVNCLECLVKTSIPKDIPLIALDEEKEKRIERALPGKILPFKDKITFTNSGYKCHDCESQEKDKYYKWLSYDGKDVLVQCYQCLENQKTIKNKILISEMSPYAMWQEEQEESEIIYSDFRGYLSKAMGSESPEDVYLAVHDYHRCIDYGNRVIEKLKNKRRRVEQKFNVFRSSGIAYLYLGKYQEALKCLLKCKELVTIVSTEKRTDLASLTFLLADVLRTLSQYQEAEKHYNETLNHQKYISGENHTIIAHCNMGLAAVCQSLRKNEKAFEYIQKALSIQKLLFGDNHIETARVYENLGLLHRNLGEYKNAHHYHKKALKIRESIFGEKHAETAGSYGHLAEIYSHFEKYQKAIKFGMKAIEIHISIYGETHPVLAATYNNLSTVFLTLERNQEALDYLHKAFEISKLSFGDEHPETASILQNLGLAYSRCGDHQKGLEYLLRAINIRKSVFGESHFEIATSYISTGVVYHKLKEYKESLKYLEKAIKIQKSAYGDEHKGLLRSYHNLAETLESLGQDKKAFEFRLKAADLDKSLSGEKYSKTEISSDNLGLMYLKLGNNEKALEYYQKSLDFLMSIFGEEHPKIVFAYSNLANVLKELGQYPKASKFWKRALRIQRSLFEGKDVETATLLNNLGALKDHLQKYQQARETYSQAHVIYESLYGKEHPTTADSYDNLGFVEFSFRRT